MAKNARYRTPFRRRREGKTDYRKRLALLKSNKPRAVIRKSLNNIQIQFVSYGKEGDKVLTTAKGNELKVYGWKKSLKNVPAAYITGFIAGKKALRKNIEQAVLDMGIQRPTKGNKIFAALKGMLDAGVDIPHGNDIFPSQDRISGQHIDAGEDFEKVMTSVKEAYK